MRTFKNDPAGFRSIRGKILKRIIPLLSMALLVGLGLGWNSAGGEQVYLLFFLVPFMVGLMAFSVNKAINQQKKLFESYALMVDDVFVCRQQATVPEIKISWDQVSAIVKNKDGSFIIQGQQKSDVIYVGSQIEGYDELEAVLSSRKEIHPGNGKPNRQSVTLGAVVAALGLMATVYISTNQYLVLVCGLLLSAGLAWSFFVIQSNKNINKKTKRASWWVLFVLIAILGITYSKFVG